MKVNKYKVKSNGKLKISQLETTSGSKKTDKEKLKSELTEIVSEIAQFQNKLYAENRQSLLIILQGMDGSGKDGTIKHIMNGVNPQGVLVHSFKHPSEMELEHDYLWRHTQKLPEKGQITIFNRSHYENVLIAKVHPELVLAERLPEITNIDKIDKQFWKSRYKQINYYEKNIIQNGTQIIKFFLNISKEEQRNRFLERIANKEKHWKFSSDDIKERVFWEQYTEAYEQALNHTSTKYAPWYVIPADEKSPAHLIIVKIILEKLKEMNPEFPQVGKEEKELMLQAKKNLMNEK
ncbi:MAG: PPK2 family polyphosphate kinase [Bacteroidota bacterium]